MVRIFLTRDVVCAKPSNHGADYFGRYWKYEIDGRITNASGGSEPYTVSFTSECGVLKNGGFPPV